MVVHRADSRLEHATFRDLPRFLRAGDAIVLNRTRVLPARFEAWRAGGGRVRGLFVRELGPGRWEVMLAPLRRVRPGEPLRLGDGRWTLRLAERRERGLCDVTVEPAAAAHDVLDAIGLTPLPPYIHRPGDATLESLDRARYQTVYADRPGAVAAPTAGLHLTDSLLEQLGAQGVLAARVTLHVGPGTFQPIEVDDLHDHRMHREWFECPRETVDLLNATQAGGGRVVAVGTTSVRVLESCAAGGPLTAGQGWTDIFIYPPFVFRAVDALITNFHLPGSTLLALVYAFGGVELMREAYRAAVDRGYRFFSYGDAMLIL